MNDLIPMLKAKLPCVWIDTYEEYEVIRDLIKICADYLGGMKLYTWSHTEGLTSIPLSKNEKETPPNPKIDFGKLFGQINEAQSNSEKKDCGVYVIKDFHLINDTHQVKRLLRDVKEKPAKNYNPVIVVFYEEG
jgi:hypothetical protein